MWSESVSLERFLFTFTKAFNFARVSSSGGPGGGGIQTSQRYEGGRRPRCGFGTFEREKPGPGEMAGLVTCHQSVRGKSPG